MPSQAANKRRAGQATAENPTKRTRVSRACDQCRLAREKCDGNQPACSTCSTAKRTCTYTANVKKRGIQPGYIRALELALAILFQHNDENESLVNDKLAQGGGTSSILLSRTSKESDKLHKRWRKTRFFAEVDKLLSGGEPSRYEHANPLSPDSNDEESDSEVVTSSVATSSQPSNVFQFRGVSNTLSKQPTVIGEAARPDDLCHVIPKDSWKLLEVYFDYTHSWLPICEKHDVLKLSYSYPAAGMQLNSSTVDCGAHAELWSILALASLYGSDKQHVSSRSNHFYRLTRSLVPDELGSFQIGHVKALLNLAVMNIATGLDNPAGILIGLAARIMTVCDQLSPFHNPKYKAVYYGCFVLDAFVMARSALTQRSMIPSRVEQLGQIDEDGLDEWQPWANSSATKSAPGTPLLALSSFNALVRLIDILNVLSLSPHESLQSLEIWKADLPEKLNHIRSPGSSFPLTPPAILLHVAAACIALTASPSRECLITTIETLHQALSNIGASGVPPIVRYLLDILEQASIALNVEQSTRDRLVGVRDGLEGASPKANLGFYANANQAPNSGQTPLAPTVGIPTPRSAADQNVSSDANPQLAHPFRQSLTHLYAAKTATQFSTPVTEPIAMALVDPGLPNLTTDLDSFFDELATLDNSRDMNNQPQFMQNLGFAPDANMADLFSEYIPLQSSDFLLSNEHTSTNMDQYGFYDGI